MKILIASKFFYPRGGAELVAINTRRLLMEHGHDVRVFAMRHAENIPLPDDDGYAPLVDFFGGIAGKLRGAYRMLGKGSVSRAARRVLEEFRPDVVHMHNVHSYLSPVVAEIAKSMGIRVVWTLHDYKLICPAYSCRRPDGSICEDCFASGPGGVLSHRCMKGSLAASLMAYCEALRWNRQKLSAITDAFIAPSGFMGEKMVRAGFDASKVKVLCNFVDPDKLAVLTSCDMAATASSDSPYFCYVGRVSAEKGVGTFLEAAARAGVNVRVAGKGPLLDEYKSVYGTRAGVEFLGHLDAVGVAALLRGAVASVLPSEWYENNPLGVIESLSTGTPVIGAEMGGIPELIIPGKDGFTYPAGDVDALTGLLRDFDSKCFDRAEIVRRADERFSTDAHYSVLMDIYKG